MTTIVSGTVRCGSCGENSEHTVLMSTNAFGSSDLDLRPPPMQRSTMSAWLQLCPHCGHCAPDLRKPPADAAVLRSPAYRAALERADVPELARRFLAYGVAVGPVESQEAADAHLHAAWACDDASQAEQAAECRRRAAEWFRQCKPFADDVGGVTVGAVLVDVLRRSGQFAEAAAECADLLASSAATGTLRKVLEFQQRLIAGADRAGYKVSDGDRRPRPRAASELGVR
jgi:hypothetical protein